MKIEIFKYATDIYKLCVIISDFDKIQFVYAYYSFLQWNHFNVHFPLNMIVSIYERQNIFTTHWQNGKRNKL